jgi:hypothetical protein
MTENEFSNQPHPGLSTPWNFFFSSYRHEGGLFLSIHSKSENGELGDVCDKGGSIRRFGRYELARIRMLFLKKQYIHIQLVGCK